MEIRKALFLIATVWIGGMVGFASCAGVNRAVIHAEDLQKVYPWPKGQKSVEIRVKPKATLESTGSVFSSFQPITVTAETTFFITDSMGKVTAYKPVHAPLSRLIQVKGIEIRWPQSAQDQPDENR